VRGSQQELDALVLPNVVQGADVRVVERGYSTRLALKPLAEAGITGDVRQKDLYSDEAIETSVASFVDLAHATCADVGQDLVRAEPRARGEGHYVERAHYTAGGFESPGTPAIA
jgi:hypothetical protein